MDTDVDTPLVTLLTTLFPDTDTLKELGPALSPPQTRLAIETWLTFVLGGDCPTHLSGDRRQAWQRNQPVALRALHNMLNIKNGAKRACDSQDADDPSAKRQKTVEEEDVDDRPLLTLSSVSTTSPVRKKVDITVHARSIRLVNPSTRVLESSVPLASITRVFLLPTRGKTKGHWTVALLPTDAPDKSKAPVPSCQQIIFGLDALSAAPFDITSYSSDTTPTTTTVAKGKGTVASLRQLLSYIPVPLLEPSVAVFRSACATAKSGEGAAGIDAYLAAKSGTLWFFDSGILWGESKPCEFWAVSDLLTKDGVRLVSATGRTCSVTLGRKNGASTDPDDMDGDGVIETVFSMVDGREQDPIHAWIRSRKHLFGKSHAVPAVTAPVNQTAGSSKAAGPSGQPNGTVKGPAWDDSDPDDEDFEIPSSEDLEYSSSVSGLSEDGSGGEEGVESEEEPEGEEGEELTEARHPLLRPGAMPRMSKAAMDMVVDLVGSTSEEEDELEE